MVRPRRRLGRFETAWRASFDLSAASRLVRPLNFTVRQHAMALSLDGIIWNRAVLDAGGRETPPWRD